MVEVDLGGQNNLVAGDVFKRPAQVFFAGPVGVDVGGVKEVNSGVEGVGWMMRSLACSSKA